MFISAVQKKHFKTIIDNFSKTTGFPERNTWRTWDDNFIWIKIVTQIVEIGTSLPGKKLLSNKHLHEEINFFRLKEASEEKEVQSQLTNVIKAIGVRFRSKAVEYCIHNFNFLVQNYDSPKTFIETVDRFETDLDKARKVALHLKGFSHKSSRDFLISLGLAENLIAFDSRLSDIFKALKLSTPKGYCKSAKKYAAVESVLLKEICFPNQITGAQFDRILFRNHQTIINMITNQEL